MIHTNKKVIKHKVGLLNLAEEHWKCLQSLQDDGLIARQILSI